MAQMQSHIAQLEDQVKKLSGDLQTSERETVGARKRVETEKFKSELNAVLQNAKYNEKEKAMNLGNVVDRMEDSLLQEQKTKTEK